MSERQLPWYVKPPRDPKTYGVAGMPEPDRMGYSVWDGAGCTVRVSEQ